MRAISEHLFANGVSSAAINALEAEIGELERIADWYKHSSGPSEAETISYLIMPILKLLNWTPQKMAIEWNNVDLALFRQLPRQNDNLCAVVEAKVKDSACLSAKSQAQYYAEQPGRENCKRLIVTDGIRYGVYLREESGFSEHPAAYLNLLSLKTEYPILKCKGAADALLMMSADWQ